MPDLTITHRDGRRGGSSDGRDQTGAAISITNLSLSYDQHVLMQGFSAQIVSGERVAVIGRSGSGKTTLVRALAGLRKPSSGRIELAGVLPQNLFGTGMLQYLHQRAVLWDHLTIRGNLEYSYQLNSKAQFSVEHCDDLMETLGLRSSAQKYPFELSEGMRARVALARVFASPPRFALVDEPFASLDPLRRDQLNAELENLASKNGTTVVMVTHDIIEALRFCDRAIVLPPNSGTPTIVPIPRDGKSLDPNQLPDGFIMLRNDLYQRMSGTTTL